MNKDTSKRTKKTALIPWAYLWSQYHNHIYGAITVVSLVFAVGAYLYPRSALPDEPVDAPRIIWPREGHDVFPADLPLRWQMPEESDGPEKYRLEFSRDRDFKTMESVFQGRDHMPVDQVFSVTKKLLEHTRAGSSAQHPRRIYWRVQAHYRNDTVSPWSTASNFSVFRDNLDRITQSRKIIIGVSSSQEDMFSCVDNEGDWVGIDIDLISELITVLNREYSLALEVVPYVLTYPWPSTKHPDEFSIWQAVQDRQVDLLISAVTATRDREEEHGVKFSRPYFSAQQTVMTDPEIEIQDLASLRRLRIGAQVGTTNQDLAEFLETQVQAYQGTDSLSSLLRDLETGLLDAVLVDEPFAYMRNRLRPISKQFLIRPISVEELDVIGYPGVKSEEYAIAVHRVEAELLQLINDSLQILESRNLFKVLKQQLQEPSKCVA